MEEDDSKPKQRITWRDIIQQEEARANEQKMAEQGIQEVAKPLTEEEATRLKEGKGEEDEDPDAVKQIGSVNPVQDFKKMISDRKTDRVAVAMR